MSETYEQIVQRRRQAAVDAFENDPVARQQHLLDRWWQEKLDAAADHRRMMRELNPTGLKIW
jgi:hypothetical protein